MAEEKVMAEEAKEPKPAKKPAAKKAAATPAAEKKAAAKKPAEKKPAAAKKPAAKKAVEKKAGITIKLVRSFAGRKDDQIATANSLGLRKIGDVTVQPDNSATKGKIAKISHLIEVINA